MEGLYLSVGVSGPGGVEVEAERGGRGGFSSSPSENDSVEKVSCDCPCAWLRGGEVGGVAVPE